LNKFLEKEATYSVNQTVKTLMEQKHSHSSSSTLSSVLSSISSTPITVSATPSSSSVAATPSSASALSNMEGDHSKQLPSFWIPSLTPAAKKAELKKPDTKVYCPMSGKPISLKDLITVNFKLASDVDPTKKPLVAVRDRYVCAVTGDLLGNSVACAILRTSGSVVTVDCVERLIKKDMIDPINGQHLKERDIIYLQRGGTGYSSSGATEARLPAPAMQ